MKGGETLRRIPVKPGDIILGDRRYSTPVGVAHVKAAQADILVRVNRQALPLFDAEGNSLSVLQLFRKMKVGQVRQWHTQVKHPSGGWVSGRLVALQRSPEATRLARRRLETNASKKQKKVSPESWEAAQYFFVWTTLADSFPAAEVLELYRLRWQIELAFKRMKSILGLGHLPKKDPASARAWLHGKIFASLLVERMVEAADKFSPGDTDWTVRRSRWREIEFMYHEVCMAILPPHTLAKTFCDWDEIAEQLAEPNRKRPRYVFC